MKASLSRLFTVSLTAFLLISQTAFANSSGSKAILLTPVMGAISPDQPQAVKFKVLSGQAKGCIIRAKAYLNPKRMRHEYIINNPRCQVNQQIVTVGSIVRGQHNISGTMANSGIGRQYLITNKGVKVSLDYQ